MPNGSPVTGIDHVFSARHLTALVVADAVLSVIANVAHGGGNQQGLRTVISTLTWGLFLAGFVLLIVSGIVFHARTARQRTSAQA